VHRPGFRRRSAATSSHSWGWVSRAYGERAGELLDDLESQMKAAEGEASLERTEHPLHDPTGVRSACGRLYDDLSELRSLLLASQVSDADHGRDMHLRAALATAIGAASSLASASSSQPTAGYLRLTKHAVEGVLSAAAQGTVE
jgi:hypothetical protein